MLRPTALTTGQYKLATKPGLGYEQQLFVTTQQSVVPATLLCVGSNSGIVTADVSDSAALLATPQELMCMLDTDLGDTAPVVLSFTGTDSTGAALTGTATFTAPAYAQDQSVVFGKGYAVEIVPTVDGKLWKTISNITIVATAAATYTQFKVVGLPSLSAFKKIGLKVSLNSDPKAPVPVAVQDGRDKGKYIKLGDIEVGTLEISGKVATSADGITRYNGVRVTGLIKEVKEDKLNTMNIFITGLIMSGKNKVGEDAVPNTIDTTAMYENYGYIMAGGAGQ